MERVATCGITTTRSGDGTLKLVERAYHVVHISRRLVDYSTITTATVCVTRHSYFLTEQDECKRKPGEMFCTIVKRLRLTAHSKLIVNADKRLIITVSSLVVGRTVYT